MKSRYTAKQRVLMTLLMRGELPLHELMSQSIGGTSADRRIRELREMGVQISWRYKDDTHTTLYKIDYVHPDVKRRIMKR